MFSTLSEDDKNLIRLSYADNTKSKEQIQDELADYFNVGDRAIRRWASLLGLSSYSKNIVDESKVMIYDIETSRVTAKCWWTGKQYVNHTQLQTEPAIISIAWKWLGDDTVHTLCWDYNHCDRAMLVKFLKEYNSADMVIGQNNDKFDNRWLNARAMKHNLWINTQIKSFDIMKQTKRLFRLPSYSMAYVSKFLGITEKRSHEGILMWDMIEDGDMHQQAEYLQKMLDYNVGDIVTTEEMYYKLKKYMGHKLHFGVFNGQENYTCPDCGTSDVRLFKTTYTAQGTIQHLMVCNEDGSQYKISNRSYMKFLDDKFNGIIG